MNEFDVWGDMPIQQLVDVFASAIGVPRSVAKQMLQNQHGEYDEALLEHHMPLEKPPHDGGWQLSSIDIA